MRERKHFPTFVLTFLLKGGLYQRMFLGRFLRDRCVSLCDSYSHFYWVLLDTRFWRCQSIHGLKIFQKAACWWNPGCFLGWMVDDWISCVRTMGHYLPLWMDSACHFAGQAWRLGNLRWFCLLLLLSLGHSRGKFCIDVFWSFQFLLAFCQRPQDRRRDRDRCFGHTSPWGRGRTTSDVKKLKSKNLIKTFWSKTFISYSAEIS